MIDAAVLVPIILRPTGSTVLLTQRAEHLRNHPGQIGFPGGRKDQLDADAVATALRELEEELNIGANEVQVVCSLDEHVTASGFRVIPVVGVMQPPQALCPRQSEVADVFEVPLQFVLEASRSQLPRINQGMLLPSYFVLHYEHRKIWGVTAGILYKLFEKTSSNTEFERILKGIP